MIRRREFLRKVSAAATMGVFGLPPQGANAEPPPETTAIRLFQIPVALCTAPEYLAEDLLREEGFTEVQYVKKAAGGGEREKALASGEVQISMGLAARHVIQVDEQAPIVLLAGVHVGCYELFGTDRVRSIRDLKGKSMRLLAEGKIDGFLGYPPEPQELRAKKIGRVVVNSMMDRPWSQYFCCVVAGNREFVRKHPVATKRALRAILRAADLCALKPEEAARFLVDRGYASNYDYTLQALRDIPYNRWREYDPEDTVRFYAVRLHEVGMIKSSPQKIIAQGTDWRFVNELKKELKG